MGNTRMTSEAGGNQILTLIALRQASIADRPLGLRSEVARTLGM